MHSECSERGGNGGGPPFPPHPPPWPGLLRFIWQTRDDGQNWIRKGFARPDPKGEDGKAPNWSFVAPEAPKTLELFI